MGKPLSKEAMRLYMRKKRIERAEQGLCVSCGARPANTDCTSCEPCLVRIRRANAKRRLEAKQ